MCRNGVGVKDDDYLYSNPPGPGARDSDAQSSQPVTNLLLPRDDKSDVVPHEYLACMMKG